MQFARQRYRHATTFQRIKMTIQYGLQKHFRNVMESAFEAIAGFLWMIGIFFVITIVTACFH